MSVTETKRDGCKAPRVVGGNAAPGQIQYGAGRKTDYERDEPRERMRSMLSTSSCGLKGLVR